MKAACVQFRVHALGRSEVVFVLWRGILSERVNPIQIIQESLPAF